jgi:NAD(P)-dependent dehydrogenase (short-subunit alcohol dehydrogenase family)
MSGRLDFSVRTAIVTGAASGMGRATAEAFAAAGANVLLADVSDVLGAEAARAIRARGGQALYQSCDVRSEDQVRALVERAVAEFGGLDFMVNNAAVLGEWVPIADQTAPNLDLVLDVNVKGVVYGMKHALAAMRPRRRGVIVNLASVQGFRVAYPGAAFYAASKAAVVSLTKSAALEYGGEGIRVVGIAPGPIDTPMLRSRTGNEWPPPIVGVTPLARLGEPHEIANAILWLCSDEAAYITGATLPVDGGFLAP